MLKLAPCLVLTITIWVIFMLFAPKHVESRPQPLPQMFGSLFEIMKGSGSGSSTQSLPFTSPNDNPISQLGRMLKMVDDDKGKKKKKSKKNKKKKPPSDEDSDEPPPSDSDE